MAETSIEVRDTLGKFLSAVESLDRERIMAFFNDDAQMFSPLGTFPARLDGRAAIGKQFDAIAEVIRSQDAGGTFKIEPLDLEVRELGSDAALLTFHLKMQGAPLHRRSFVLTRGANGWRIAHIHASIASSAPLKVGLSLRG